MGYSYLGYAWKGFGSCLAGGSVSIGLIDFAVKFFNNSIIAGERFETYDIASICGGICYFI